MGRQLIKEVLLSEGAELSGALEQAGSPHLGEDVSKLIHQDPVGIAITEDVETVISEADAIIDFTSPKATLNFAETASRLNTMHIIGTTGLSGEQEHTLEKYAHATPIVYAPNMSVGVNLLMALTEKVAAILDDSTDIEIVEMHHNKKVDAPSGTALGLGKAAANGRKVALADIACYTREGQTGVRPRGEIGFATLRGGDVIGDHTVIFAGAGERIELTHKASNRDIYAKGAIRAAFWANDQKPGLYSMQDVLGINS